MRAGAVRSGRPRDRRRGQRAIQRATKGRTTFLITHRLSQIRWADLIIVLRKGQVAALGSHEDLLRTSEPYRRIFAPAEPSKQGAAHDLHSTVSQHQ